MVAAGPVHVPVRELFLGGRAHRGHLDLEVEALAGERVIAIECHEVATEVRDGHRTRTLRGVSLQPHADPHVADTLQCAPRYLLYEALVVFPVTIGWRDLHLQPVAGLATRQRALESRDEIAVTMQVREWLALGGAVDELTGIIAQRVMDTDDLILADAHAGSDVAGNAALPRARRARRATGGREGYHCSLPATPALKPRGQTARELYENLLPGRLNRRLRHHRACR